MVSKRRENSTELLKLFISLNWSLKCEYSINVFKQRDEDAGNQLISITTTINMFYIFFIHIRSFDFCLFNFRFFGCIFIAFMLKRFGNILFQFVFLLGAILRLIFVCIVDERVYSINSLEMKIKNEVKTRPFFCVKNMNHFLFQNEIIRFLLKIHHQK